MSKLLGSLTCAALVGAGLLAGPLSALAADRTQAATGAPPPAAAKPAAKARETVEQRIAGLHAALKITADEEANWSGVTKAMRDSAAAMQKLSSEQSAKDPATLTAVDDLKTYERFSQAHVDGLKALTASFEVLYGTMPDAQKKIADAVFHDAGHRGHRAKI
jgi:hypothetical protein